MEILMVVMTGPMLVDAMVGSMVDLMVVTMAVKMDFLMVVLKEHSSAEKLAALMELSMVLMSVELMAYVLVVQMVAG